MQNNPPRSSSRDATRQRLLDAAARVFARQGLAGSTTRAIAEEAGVNEVTLFRHFQTKDGLLAAVVGYNFSETRTPADEPPATTNDLRADLLAHAIRYNHLMQENLPLVRTMLGEIHHHHRDQEKQVFVGIFAPVKADLRARIEAAHNSGELRREIAPDLLADLFAAMIFTGVLRRAAPDVKLDYSADAYLQTAVDLIIRGAAGGPPIRPDAGRTAAS